MERRTLFDSVDVINEQFHYDQNPQAVTFNAYTSGLDDPDVTNLTTGQQIAAEQGYYEESDHYQNATVSFTSGMLATGNYQLAIYSQRDYSVNFVDDGFLLDNDLFKFLRGDVNRDDVVNAADASLVSSNLNTTNATYAQGDLNADGVINSADAALVSANYGIVLHGMPDFAGQIVAQPTSSGTVELNWGAYVPRFDGDTIDGYHLFKSVDGGPFEQIGTVGNTVTHFSVTGLTDGWRYAFRVRPFTNAGGNGPSVNRSVAVTVMKPVTDLSASPQADGTVHVSWTNHSATAMGEYLDLRTDNGDWFAYGGADSSSNSVDLSGLIPGAHYFVRVHANNDYADSAPTEAEFIAPLPPPDSFTATASSSTSIDLEWHTPTDSEPAHRITVSPSVGTGWSIDVPAGASSYTLSGLQDGVQYDFDIVSTAGSNSNPLISDFGPLASVITPLKAPTEVVATNTHNATNDIELYWQNGSTHYDNVIVRVYPVTNGVIGTTPSQTITLGGATTQYTLANNAPTTNVAVTVQGVNTKTESGESGKSQNMDEPTQTWTDIYDNHMLASGAGSHATEIWSSNDVSFSSQSVSLTLGNLPRHTWARVVGYIDVNGPSSATGVSEHFMVKVDETIMPITNTTGGGDIEADVNFGIGVNISGRPDAFRHTDKNMKISFTPSGLPTGWFWSPHVWVETYLPFVTISNTGNITEDDHSPNVIFTVTRTGSGTVLSDSLLVKLEIAGTAQNSVDYTQLDDVAVIPSGHSSVDGDSESIDDDSIEHTYESILVTVANPAGTGANKQYAQGTQPWTECDIQDDDFKIIAAQVAFPNSQDIRLDNYTGSYSMPQWSDIDHNLKNDIDFHTVYSDSGKVGAPVSFERSTDLTASPQVQANFIQANPTFYVYGNPQGQISIVGSGSGPGGGLFFGNATVTNIDPATVAGLPADPLHLTWAVSGTFSPTHTSNYAGKPLPDTIQSDTLAIDWKVKKESGEPVNYGTTKNHIYVTGVAAPDEYETVLDIGCIGASGLRPRNPSDLPADAVNHDIAVSWGIWDQFADDYVLRVDGILMSYSHLVVNGTDQFAYVDAGLDTDGNAGMLARPDGRGQCTAWAGLLVRVLNSQGERASSVEVNAPGGRVNAFSVISMAAQGSNGVAYNGGVFPGAFRFHQVVRINLISDIIFDPSYGGIAVKKDAADLRNVELIYEDTYITDLFFLNRANPRVVDLPGDAQQITIQ